jgi:uncharacterized membrane protein
VGGESDDDEGRAQPSGRSGIEYGLLAAIVVLAAAVRFWGLGAQSLWYDEWSTVQGIDRTLPDLLTFVGEREGAPPGYFLVAWFWVRIFGRGDGALRALSALAGTGLVPVVYAIVREAGRGRTAAKVAALLVAVHPLLVWYSQEARPYSMLVLAGGASFLCFLRALRRAAWTDLLLWGVVSAAAVAVHYFAAFLLLPEAVLLVMAHRRRWGLLVPAFAPLGVVSLALAPTLIEQRRHGELQHWITDFELWDRVVDAGGSALVGPSPPVARLWILVLVPVLVAVYLGLRADPGTRRTFVISAGVGIAAALVPLLGQLVGTDLFLGRYLVAALVPLIVAVAVGLTVPAARWIGPVCIAALCLASAVSLVHVARSPAQQRPPWRGVADTFEDGPGVERGSRILVVNRYGNLAKPLWHYVDGDVRTLEADEEATATEIDVVTLRPSTAPCNFLVGSACAYLFLGGPLPPPLDDRFELVDRQRVGPFSVDRYRTETPTPVSKEMLTGALQAPDSLVLVGP